MGDGTTDHRFTRALIRTCMALVAGLLLLLGVVGPASAESSGEYGALVAQERRLDHQVIDLQRQVLLAASEHAEVEDQRDRALTQLSAHVVALYKQGEMSPLAMVLTSRDLNSAINSAQLSRDLTRYESRLVDLLDDAEEQARLGIDRQQVISQQIVTTQSSLQAVRMRLAVLHDRRSAQSEAKARNVAARQRAAQAAAQPVSMLASYASSGIAFAGSVQVVGNIGPASATGIDAYLTAKGSPMAGAGFFFMMSGQRWGLDPRLVVAIAGAESNFGAATCGRFNAWGWACPNDPVQFSSWADGIDAVNEGLRTNYIDEGRTSIVLIQQKYAPSGAANDPTGLNNNWVQNVSRFLQEQGGNPYQVVLAHPTSGTATSGASIPVAPFA